MANQRKIVLTFNYFYLINLRDVFLTFVRFQCIRLKTVVLPLIALNFDFSITKAIAVNLTIFFISVPTIQLYITEHTQTLAVLRI